MRRLSEKMSSELGYYIVVTERYFFTEDKENVEEGRKKDSAVGSLQL